MPGTRQPGTRQPGTRQPGTRQPGTRQPGTVQRRARRRVLSAALCTLVLAVAGCGGDPQAESSASSITVGKSSADVDRVLGEIYAGALRRGGAEVTVAPVDGSPVDALASGAVSFVAGFTGSLLGELDSRSTARTPDAVFEALNRSLPEWLSVTDPAAAEGGPVVLASDRTAARLSSTDIEGLVPVCGELAVGVEVGVAAALEALGDVAGCRFGRTDRATAGADLVRAVAAGEIDVAVVSAVDLGPEDTGTGAVPLEDVDDVFTAQNVVPLFRRDGPRRDGLAREGFPTERERLALGVVAGELTTAALADMVDRVRRGESDTAVAQSWLQEQNF